MSRFNVLRCRIRMALIQEGVLQLAMQQARTTCLNRRTLHNLSASCLTRTSYAGSGISTSCSYIDSTVPSAARKVHNASPQEPLDVGVQIWKSWQLNGQAIEEIEEQFKISRDRILKHIFDCVGNGALIDWVEMGKEIGFDKAVMDEIREALPDALQGEGKAKIAATFRTKSRSGFRQIQDKSPTASQTQIKFFLLMLECGFSIPKIGAACLDNSSSNNEESPSHSPSTSPSPSPSPSPALVSAKKMTKGGDAWDRLREVSKEIVSARKINKSFIAHVNGSKHLLDHGLISWLRQRKGASLVEIAAAFSDCGQSELVTVIATLERNRHIRVNEEGKYIFIESVHIS